MSTEASQRPVVFPAVKQTGRSDSQDRGYVQGHAAGYAAGLRAAAAEQARVTARMQAEHEAAVVSGREAVRHAVTLLGAAAAAFQQRFDLVLQDAETVLATSALDLAQAVLGYELEGGERTARAAVHRALSGGTAAPGESARGAAAPDVAAVRLNPADIAVLAASGITREIGVELVPDPSLARGDAMAQYPEGWLDARLGTSLARARAALLGPAQPGQPREPHRHGEPT